MLRRVVAVALWAYFGWYLAAHIGTVTPLPIELAPAGGLIMVGIAVVDWRRLLSAPRRQVEQSIPS
jgi:hypothetical protein